MNDPILLFTAGFLTGVLFMTAVAWMGINER